MTTVILVHGWGGNPESCWFPWLKKQLEERDITVMIPEMPNTEEPDMEEWIETLQECAGPDTYFVGHSIGCQAILRLLAQGSKASGTLFVAGWFKLKGLDEEEHAIAQPWLETPINLSRVQHNCPHFFALFSDDDPFVPLTDVERFKELGARTVVQHEMGHFDDDQGTVEIPIVLDELLKMIGMDDDQDEDE